MFEYLITGSKGYIGSRLVDMLLEKQKKIKVIDNNYFDDCNFEFSAISDNFNHVKKDIRDLEIDDFKNVKNVIHLAALSNDPIGNLNSSWTDQINNEATVKMAKLAKNAGVRKFIFSSSCIMYGNAESDEVNEETPVDPNTDYALSKVLAEKKIMEISDNNFSVTSLRNGTVYGLSKFMRFDTVTNDFLGSALTKNEIIIKGDGEPWRPVVHVDDVCRSFIMISEENTSKIAGQIFNNGADKLNIKVKDLAQIVKNEVPDTKIKILNDAETDSRSYKASFKKFKDFFPNFDFKFTPELGVKDLHNKLILNGFKSEDYESGKFIRLKKLSNLINQDKVDKDLKWK
tara:strand:- start:2674 stop:3705 length:1032 start_codon:yes stop_codon:yes gene_type:complete